MTPWRANPVGLLWLGFFALILASWILLFLMTVGAPGDDLPAAIWEAFCGDPLTAGFPTLVGMWALMTAAMMLPTFVPALRTFLHLGAAGATRIVDGVTLVAGYVLIWTAAAVIGAWGQLELAKAGLLSPDGSSLSSWLSSGLLLTAGLYQWTHLKAACLAKCRMPLTFFMERWVPGTPRAFRMGVELGLICFGCCWALMALAFVGGTMNLIWMGAATLFMIMEKLPDIGRFLTRPAGWLLVLAAGAHAFAALFS